MGTNFNAHVAQLVGGVRLKSGTVRVRISSWVPFYVRVAQLVGGVCLRSITVRVRISPRTPIYALIRELVYPIGSEPIIVGSNPTKGTNAHVAKRYTHQVESLTGTKTTMLVRFQSCAPILESEPYRATASAGNGLAR